MHAPSRAVCLVAQSSPLSLVFFGIGWLACANYGRIGGPALALPSALRRSSNQGSRVADATPGDWLAQVGAPSPLPGCPMPWLAEYEAFHAANRGKPGAKYLVHAVTDRMSGGLGDRLRGMLYVVRAAAASRRVVLFKWTHPHALMHFFEPGGPIDWRPDGLNLPPPGQEIRAIDSPVGPVVDGSLLNATDDVIVVHTNRYMDATCKGCPPLSLWGADAPCLWTRVFKPVATVQWRAQQQLQELFGRDALPRYVAIHMRLGGLAGETELDRVRGGGTQLGNFMAAVSCGQRLLHSHGIRVPLLMVVDSHEVRERLKDRGFPSVVTPAGAPVHLDRADGASIEQHQATIVDLALLARAECLVTSPSGFSHHAWLAGGGKACQRVFFDCANVTGGPGGGPDDGSPVQDRLRSDP